jgi:heme/copper-type cytochrome/quinol oxidase subunit 2
MLGTIKITVNVFIFYHTRYFERSAKAAEKEAILQPKVSLNIKLETVAPTINNVSIR